MLDVDLVCIKDKLTLKINTTKNHKEAAKLYWKLKLYI